jgi:tetratricopeptide (TPR) repeat protein
MQEIIKQAVATHRAGNLEEAEGLYLKILHEVPRHPVANHNLGILKASIGDIASALRFLRIAHDVDPSQSIFWISLIDTLIKDMQIDEAKKILDQGIKKGLAGEKVDELSARLTSLNTQANPIIKKLSFIQDRKKKSAKKERKKQLTKQQLNSSQNNGPSNDDITKLLTLYHSRQYEVVERLSAEMVQIYPKNQFIWKVLGASLSSTGKFQEAVIANKKAIELVPRDSEAHSNLGNVLMELGRLEDCEVCYRQAIAIKPDYAEAHSNLGSVLQKLGRLEDCEVCYRQAIAIKPDYAEAHNNLGSVLQELGRLEDCEVCYRQALAIKSDFAEAHCNLGGLLLEIGRFEEAKTSYQNTLFLVKDHVDANAGLGKILLSQGYHAEALHKINKAHGCIIFDIANGISIK